MYLDRNGIMCDNILELVPYMYGVHVNLSKDSAAKVIVGTWELTVINKLKLIGHFLLRP